MKPLIIITSILLSLICGIAYANPYYEKIHCFNQSLYEPSQKDIAACNATTSGQYLCPIGVTACNKKPETQVDDPIYSCPPGATDNGSQCVAEVEMCKFSHAEGYYIARRSLLSYNVAWWDGKLLSGKVGISWTSIGGAEYKLGSYQVSIGSENPTHYYSICKRWMDFQPYEASCKAGYEYRHGRCEKTVMVDVCPLGNEHACVTNGSAAFCSPNTCFDPNTTKDIQPDGIDGTMLTNNGDVNATGMCLDQVYIFSGRAQKCRKQGVQTAFQDCCKTDGKVMKDGGGSIQNTILTTQSISAVFQASKAAYTVMQSGGTMAAATGAFKTAFVGAFDPASLAITVAITLVMEYLTKACDQIEAETALQNSSDRCVYLGEYCKEKWLGRCMQKAKSFCCFNSELATIINREGRKQLKSFQHLGNGGFGDTKSPDCRGFTPEEFQALDFSNIDMSSYYDELIHRSQSEIQETMLNMTTEHFNNVK